MSTGFARIAICFALLGVATNAAAQKVYENSVFVSLSQRDISSAANSLIEKSFAQLNTESVDLFSHSLQTTLAEEKSEIRFNLNSEAHLSRCLGGRRVVRTFVARASNAISLAIRDPADQCPIDARSCTSLSIIDATVIDSRSRVRRVRSRMLKSISNASIWKLESDVDAAILKAVNEASERFRSGWDQLENAIGVELCLTVNHGRVLVSQFPQAIPLLSVEDSFLFVTDRLLEDVISKQVAGNVYSDFGDMGFKTPKLDFQLQRIVLSENVPVRVHSVEGKKLISIKFSEFETEKLIVRDLVVKVWVSESNVGGGIRVNRLEFGFIDEDEFKGRGLIAELNQKARRSLKDGPIEFRLNELAHLSLDIKCIEFLDNGLLGSFEIIR